jgi:membrane associated rhomboid family serine protease
MQQLLCSEANLAPMPAPKRHEHIMSSSFGLSITLCRVIGVLLTYVICAIGSGIVFALVNPKGVLVGASGAVFGMFVTSFLLKLRFSFRKLLEAFAVAPFVWTQLMSNVSAQWGNAGGNVAYIAHLGGALTGLLMVTLLSILPDDVGNTDQTSSKSP